MTHTVHVPTLQIMKSDEDVRMISAEAPVLFARVRARAFDAHAAAASGQPCQHPS